MKRTVVALSILGLVYAVALPAAKAGMLYQDDFSTDKLLKDPSTYVQGLGSHARDEDPTLKPWYIYDGGLTSTPQDGGAQGTDTTGGSDGTGAQNDASTASTVTDFLLLTGDPKWADVSVEARIYSNGQNTGSFAVILRAAPKTKPSDPDSWYEFDYWTAQSTTGDITATKEGLTWDQDASGIPVPTAVPDLRIMKVVNHKWKLLAETDFNKSKDHIPEVNEVGVDHDSSGGSDDSHQTGAIFRFVAKGNVLQAWCALPGKPFIKYLEVTDDELKAGKVGFTHCEYNPVFHDMLVQDAP